MAHGAQQALDHLALRGDDDHPLARPTGSVEHPERVEVEHGAGKRHRHLILGLEAHRRGELLTVGHRRQFQHAQHSALVCEADPHALAEPSVLEELLQRVAERGLVIHLALADRIGGQRRAGGLLDDDPAIDMRLHGGDISRLDIEADNIGATMAADREAEVGQCAELGHWKGFN